MKCQCGHDESEHDKNGERPCLADTNQRGRRYVFCKCKKFIPISEDSGNGGSQ